MELFKPGRVYDFMGQRVFWIPLSIVLIVVSCILMIVPGPNYGTDFKGGTEVEIAFTGALDANRVREAVAKSGFASPDVVQVQDKANAAHFLIRVQEVSALDDAKKHAIEAAMCHGAGAPSDCPNDVHATEVKFSAGGDKISARFETEPNLASLSARVKAAGVSFRESETNPQVVNPRDHRVEIQVPSKGDELVEGLRRELGAELVPERPLRVEWVGPKAGKQLRDGARNSVAIAIVFIMLYLALRFDLRFAPGVVLACVHDAVVVIGVFIALRKEITLSTIAAVLTIVGYSMNDTIVVYDRIRENLGKHKKKTFAEVINLSVSETLSRTLLTSGATMLSVLAFLVWGTGVIKDFALAMIIGIVAGTYSSIYVAAPLTEWIDGKLSKSDAVKNSAARRASAQPG
jgi:preprotein translocase subunit SecF